MSNMYIVIIFAGTLAAVGFALWKKVKDVAGVAKEAKEAMEAIVSAFHPDSDGGTQPTTEELIKIFKEVADVIRKLKEKDE